MSFILDALKKSESDRQRQSGPSLFEVKVAPPRRTLPIWAVAIAVLLGVNVIVVSWMLLRHAPAQTPATAASAAAPPPKAVAAAGPTIAARVAPAPVAGNAAPPSGGAAAAPSGPAPSPTPGPASGSAPGPATSPAASTLPPPETPLASRAGQSADEAPAGGSPGDYEPAVEPADARGADAPAAGGTLPLYQQIVTSAGLPELHLDLHVFAGKPQDRFVMINMRKLGEGDTLPNGVQVETIRPDGVVLSYHGTRFLLPRD